MHLQCLRTSLFAGKSFSGRRSHGRFVLKADLVVTSPPSNHPVTPPHIRPAQESNSPDSVTGLVRQHES
jgi:hypothetical protein